MSEPSSRTTAEVVTADLRRAGGMLRVLVSAIESGELTAPPLLVARLEGAIVALEALASGRQPTAEDFLGPTSLHDTVLSVTATAFGRTWDAPGLANDWLVGVEQPTSEQTVRMTSLMKGILPLLVLVERYGVTEVGGADRGSRRPPLGATEEVVDASRRLFSLGAVLTNHQHRS